MRARILTSQLRRIRCIAEPYIPDNKINKRPLGAAENDRPPGPKCSSGSGPRWRGDGRGPVARSFDGFARQALSVLRFPMTSSQ